MRGSDSVYVLHSLFISVLPLAIQLCDGDPLSGLIPSHLYSCPKPFLFSMVLCEKCYIRFVDIGFDLWYLAPLSTIFQLCSEIVDHHCFKTFF